MRAAVPVLLLFLASTAAAGTRVVAPRTRTTVALDRHLATKYPELSPLLRNPDKFFSTMERRFEQQKQRTPGSPYDFDFSELGMPLVRSLHADLGAELSRQRARPATKESRVAIELLTKLTAEAGGHLERGTVGYKPLIELAYFTSRTLGHFHFATLTRWQRTLLAADRRIQGYKALPLEEERTLYEQRRFDVFQVQSSSPTMRDAAPAFEHAFHNADKLESLWVPSTAAIDRDVLMRLMPKPIEVVGVTATPVQADGFLRPAGDFWMHDVRHSAVKLQKRERFIARNKLSPKTMAALDSKADAWNGQLEREVAKVEDKSLAAAIRLLAFNFHHDRGFVVAPSEYLGTKGRRWVPGLLYATLKVGGEGVEFGKPISNFRKADAWLTRFWQARLADEHAVTSLRD